VGKTSMSLSIAIAASQMNRKVAAITIDPSKRLSAILDFDKELQSQEINNRVFLNENLTIFHVDTEKSFFDFVSSHISKDQYSKLSSNKIFKQISKNLRETHNFVSLYEMVKLVDSNQYDLIILDTPPSDQVIDFFESPMRLLQFFSPRLGEKKKEWLNWVKNKSLKLFESILSRLVGKEFVEQMESFFEGISQIRDQVQIVSRRFMTILNDEKSKIILVYSPALDKVKEAQFLQSELQKNNLSVDYLIMNRAYIPALDQSKADSIAKDSREEELYTYFSEKKKESVEVMKSMKKFDALNKQKYVLIPEVNINLQSEEDIYNFSKKITQFWIEE
jgi:anion-transporting  ArsA/GET3 family ATPase